jgi:hypothetical protein
VPRGRLTVFLDTGLHLQKTWQQLFLRNEWAEEPRMMVFVTGRDIDVEPAVTYAEIGPSLTL